MSLSSRSPSFGQNDSLLLRVNDLSEPRDANQLRQHRHDHRLADLERQEAAADFILHSG